MKKIFVGLIVAIAVVIAIVFIFGEEQEIKYSTIPEIVENAVALDKKDIVITLTGKVTSQISKKRFWFQTADGESIVMDVKNEMVPLVPATDQIIIKITGKVDCETTSGEGVKIDVDEISFDQEQEPEEEQFM